MLRESRLAHGNTGVFPEGVQQIVQILLMGKAAYLLFSIVADHQIAQRAVYFPLLEESLVTPRRLYTRVIADRGIYPTRLNPYIPTYSALSPRPKSS